MSTSTSTNDLGYFRPLGTSDLSQKTSRSGASTLAAQLLKFLLQIGSTAILARLLTPDDFGLVAMVLVFTGFLSLFSDLGLTQATVQRPTLNHEQSSSLFWISVILGITIGGIVALCSPLVADFYGRSELQTVTAALGGAMLLNGIGVQHRSLLMRNMSFGKLAIAEVAAQVIGVVAAIILARAGAGYWALVSQSLALAASQSIITIILTGWIPGRPRFSSDLAPFLKYGSNLAGFNVVNFFSRNGDNILLGWYAGGTALGFYSKAYQLLLLPMAQINAPLSRVFLPALSRLVASPPEYRRFYITALSTISYPSIAIVAFVGTAVEEIVFTVLGASWQPCVPIFYALLPAAYFSASNTADGWVYMSRGNTSRQFRWYLLVAPFTVACMALGLKWGAIGVALGASAGYSISKPFSIAYAFRGTPLKFYDFLRSTGRPTFISGVSAIMTLLISDALAIGPTAWTPAVALGAKAAIFFLCWAGLDLLTPVGPSFLRQIPKLVRHILPPHSKRPITNEAAA